MTQLPLDTCIYCDMPWKNNRVCYDGCRRIRYTINQIELGDLLVKVTKDGNIIGTTKIGETAFSYVTQLQPNAGTLAYDALTHRMYMSAGNTLAGVSLDTGVVEQVFFCKGTAGSPLLFQWQGADGEPVQAIGSAEDTGVYHVWNRETGSTLWQAQILGVTVDTAAHLDGFLYLTLAGKPFQVLCLDARNGDLVWWNKGRGEAVGGVICHEEYHVQNRNGEWFSYSLVDGEQR